MALIPARLRRKPSQPIAAAATELPATDTASTSAVRKYKAQDWQLEVMDYFHCVPELKKAGRWAAQMMSKVNLYVAAMGPDESPVRLDAVDPETGAPLVDLPPALKETAEAELMRLDTYGVGGLAGIQLMSTLQFDFPGECWLIGYGEREVAYRDRYDQPQTRRERERWEIRAINEVVVRDGKTYILDGSSRDGRLLDDGPDGLDTKIRMWQPDPWHQEQADSNIRAVITECRLLQALSGKMYAETVSRQSAGAITVPKGLTQQKVPTAKQRSTGDQVVEQSKFSYDMVTAITRAAADQSDVAAVARMIIEGENEDLKPDVLRTIDFGRDDNGQTDDKIKVRIERIGHAVNLPIEVMLGHKDTTFNNAQQISEDEFTEYLEPRCLLQTENLTEGFLWPQLRENPLYAWSDDLIEQLFVWYDPTPLFDEPDPQESATDAIDRLAIGWRGYRKLTNIPEDLAPDEDELAAMIAARAALRGSTPSNLPGEGGAEGEDDAAAMAAGLRLVADGRRDPLALGPPGDSVGAAGGTQHPSRPRR